MTELEQHIAALFDAKVEELKTIAALFHPITLKKGDYFLQADTYSKQLGYVQAGILREFVLHEGNEVTKWIATKGYFVVDLSSFMFNTPARSTFRALSDCELYVINKADYQQLESLSPTWNTREKRFLAKCFSMLEDRVLSHLSMTAEERYDHYWNFNKELFNQVPLNYIASMLGMSPETFSRIRKKRTAIS